MKAKCLSLFGALAAFAAFGAVPEVKNVTWSQAADSQVTVNYDLIGDGRAIVTLDVLTNGVSIGLGNITHLCGDVSRVVASGTGKRLYWQPEYDWADHAFGDGEITCKVTAWALDNPPDYMAVDLVYTNMCWYYTAPEAVPGGVTNSQYLSRYLLMRRIHAGGKTFMMGTPVQETYHNGVGANYMTGDPYYCKKLDETRHPVTFTKDYYIGVFEWTVAQKGYVYGSLATPTDFSPESTVYQYFADRATKLREHTSIAFAVPTEAQWEYACRAGTDASLYSGKEVPTVSNSTGANAPTVNELGFTAAYTESMRGHSIYTRERGGQLKPNAWGLYDMFGNVSEWCSDWVDETPLSSNPVVDPTGLATGTLKAMRGGCSAFWFAEGRCGARVGYMATGSYGNFVGGRFVCPVTVTH